MVREPVGQRQENFNKKTVEKILFWNEKIRDSFESPNNSLINRIIQIQLKYLRQRQFLTRENSKSF